MPSSKNGLYTILECKLTFSVHTNFQTLLDMEFSRNIGYNNEIVIFTSNIC